MNLEKAYLAGHKACGLKVGDKVKILRKAKDCEQGCNLHWESCMNKFVGNSYYIERDHNIDGFEIGECGERGCFCLPWFVLEKVEEEQKIKTSDLDFRCQQQNVESLVQRIINYIDKEK